MTLQSLQAQLNEAHTTIRDKDVRLNNFVVAVCVSVILQ